MVGFGDTVLRASGVGKIYSRAQTETRARVGRALARAALGIVRPGEGAPTAREFWSLKDINLTLSRGEAVGIIGLNGAGKTTLLRILAGQILPDAGEVQVVGRTASMIDLTAGFQVAASGRENIYLRGAALGRSRAEMDATAADIIAFAELGDAIEAPVATYSSGMTMRLAFSIMVASTPDILFIDEVLAVGDFQFRQKCLERLRQIRERTSFVMVSHNMSDIRSFCSRVIVLNKGQAVFAGPPEEAIAVFESLNFPEPVSREQKIAGIVAPMFANSNAVKDVSNYWCDACGTPVDAVRSGDPVHFRLEATFEYSPRTLVIGIPIWTVDGTYATGFSTTFEAAAVQVSGGVRSAFELEVPSLMLNAGEYVSIIGIMDGPEYLYRKDNPLLTVTPRHRQTWGIVTLPHSWRKYQAS